VTLAFHTVCTNWKVRELFEKAIDQGHHAARAPTPVARCADGSRLPSHSPASLHSLACSPQNRACPTGNFHPRLVLTLEHISASLDSSIAVAISFSDGLSKSPGF